MKVFVSVVDEISQKDFRSKIFIFIGLLGHAMTLTSLAKMIFLIAEGRAGPSVFLTMFGVIIFFVFCSFLINKNLTKKSNLAVLMACTYSIILSFFMIGIFILSSQALIESQDIIIPLKNHEPIKPVVGSITGFVFFIFTTVSLLAIWYFTQIPKIVLIYPAVPLALTSIWIAYHLLLGGGFQMMIEVVSETNNLGPHLIISLMTFSILTITGWIMMQQIKDADIDE